MARCDEGYPCGICGVYVDAVADSDLYLRYILGEVPLEKLHLHPDRHVRCNTELAQYIVDPAFASVVHEGPFDKRHLEASFVGAEEHRVTRGWRRLQAIPRLGLSIPEYPLAVTPDDDNHGE